ncbi:YsnF/AvaK domain-containing protein [Microvirga massiliensis]|uniref:YsnF/AvaK domain-containing protein n=1 Tax=Microvirga massiliensis TaxID=1033741 RepID=UPI0007C7B0CB|nr:YsnF/AvaK domain-containing protein [Microvirga massiliensis]
MSDKTITSFFDSYDDAAEAVRRLEAAGVPSSDISLVTNNHGDRHSHLAPRSDMIRDDETATDEGAGTGAAIGTLAGGGAGLLAGLGLLAIPGLGPVVAAGWLTSTLVGAGAGAAVGGLVGALAGAGVPETEARAYEEGIRRGGSLVTVRARESDVDRIVDILDGEGTVDLDERQEAWRAGGWTSHGDAIGAAALMTTGMTTGEMPIGTGTSRASEDVVSRDVPSAETFGTQPRDMAPRATSVPPTARSVDSGREEVIPIAEEELQVGKRERSGGRVRISSHVVERPMQEPVSLREEHVEIERHPVEGARTRTGESADDPFQDRTIEMEERSEEPVVSKEVRVREELRVHKDVDQRTQTVEDTVRRTEVEVERQRRGTGTDRDRS